MTDVIQIYKSKGILEKLSYTPQNRKHFSNLNETVVSENGYVENGILYLQHYYRNHPDLQTADLIIIQDTDGFNPFLIHESLNDVILPEGDFRSRRDFLIKDNKHFAGLRQLSTPKSFELFKICKSGNDTFELFLDYASNAMIIGMPERENHKIGELKKNQPLRYKINGKADFTLTGRKQRTFCEFDYIFEWIGQVDKIGFQELNKLKKTKKIPLAECKLIDERKILK